MFRPGSKNHINAYMLAVATESACKYSNKWVELVGP